MRRILLGLSLLLITLSPVAHADTVSIPNTFVNGTPADAEQMNANFDEVEAAVNDNDARITAAQDTASAAAGAAGGNSAAITALQGGVSSNAETISNLDAFANFLADDAEAAAFSVTAAQSTATTAQAASDANAALIAELEARIVSCPACPDCGSSDFFDQGFNTGAASVDITSDNAAVCTTAGGTYDAGADSCSVDITTDNAAAQAVAAAAAGNAACTQAGGTWEAGTSTCTPAPAASSYNCFVAGFCAQAAIDFPPGVFGYINDYEGHTQGTEPALGAGCNLFPGSTLWDYGFSVLILNSALPLQFGFCAIPY